MALGDQINFRPEFQTTKVPCSGQVGDLIVLTPLKEGEFDPKSDGSPSVWVCVKADQDVRPALWLRVQFDGFAMCDAPVAPAAQGHPRLVRG